MDPSVSGVNRVRSLVCDECWRLMFNTCSYESLCTIQHPSSHRRLTYVTTRAVLDLQASKECSWCNLIRLLISDECPPEADGELPKYKAYELCVTASGLHHASDIKIVGPNHLSIQLYVNHEDWGDSGCTADEWRYTHRDGYASDSDSVGIAEFGDEVPFEQGPLESYDGSPQAFEAHTLPSLEQYVPMEFKGGYTPESNDCGLNIPDEIDSTKSEDTTFAKCADFYTYTLPSDPAAAHVNARPIVGDVSPAATQQQVRSWLRQCNNHASCQPQHDVQLPKRLIYLGSPDEIVKLVDTTEASSLEKYAALSYCWGGAQNYSPTKSNLDHFKVSLDPQAMAPSILDAISVARMVPVDYLWVDALCIIQDSAGDKDVELAKMHSVYRNALVTIVAASSSSTSRGFLRTLSPSTKTCHLFGSDQMCRFEADKIWTVPFRITEGRFGSISLQCHNCLSKNLDGEDEPINQRAWTLQEQLLGQRLLTYTTNTLQWHCKAGIQHMGDFMCDIEYSYWGKMYRLGKSSLEAYSNDWLGLIELFSRRKLSFAEDLFPAISALAQAFSDRFGPGYWAGIWERAGLRQLQWVVSRSSAIMPPLQYRAPSWSWASTNCEVSYQYASPGQDPMVQVLGVHTTLVFKHNPLGRISDGKIKLLGKTKKGFLVSMDGSKGPEYTERANLQSWANHWPLGIIWKTDEVRSLASAEAHFQEHKESWDSFEDERSGLYLDAVQYRRPGPITCVQLFTNFSFILRRTLSKRRTFRRIGAIAHCGVREIFDGEPGEQVTII